MAKILNGTVGTLEPEYLLASDFHGHRIAVSLEPGNGTVKRGTVLYRKDNSVLYAPAASANITAGKDLVILGEEVDTDESATVAMSAMAYQSGDFLRGYVLQSDGETPITAAHEIVLRSLGFTFKPMEDYSKDAQTVDNTATVSVTVQNDTHGTGSASPASGTYGTEVTLTATPSSNYVFDYWEVVSGDVTVVDNKFTIGDKAVTVKAHFKAST